MVEKVHDYYNLIGTLIMNTEGDGRALMNLISFMRAEGEVDINHLLEFQVDN